MTLYTQGNWGLRPISTLEEKTLPPSFLAFIESTQMQNGPYGDQGQWAGPTNNRWNRALHREQVEKNRKAIANQKAVRRARYDMLNDAYSIERGIRANPPKELQPKPKTFVHGQSSQQRSQGTAPRLPQGMPQNTQGTLSAQQLSAARAALLRGGAYNTDVDNILNNYQKGGIEAIPDYLRGHLTTALNPPKVDKPRAMRPDSAIRKQWRRGLTVGQGGKPGLGMKAGDAERVIQKLMISGGNPAVLTDQEARAMGFTKPKPQPSDMDINLSQGDPSGFLQNLQNRGVDLRGLSPENQAIAQRYGVEIPRGPAPQQFQVGNRPTAELLGVNFAQPGPMGHFSPVESYSPPGIEKAKDKNDQLLMRAQALANAAMMSRHPAAQTIRARVQQAMSPGEDLEEALIKIYGHHLMGHDVERELTRASQAQSAPPQNPISRGIDYLKTHASIPIAPGQPKWHPPRWAWKKSW
jgi:hypothetical protein